MSVQLTFYHVVVVASALVALGSTSCNAPDDREAEEESWLTVRIGDKPTGRQLPSVLVVASFERVLRADGFSNVDWVLLPTRKGRPARWLERQVSVHLLNLSTGAVSTRVLKPSSDTEHGWVGVSRRNLDGSFFLELRGAYAEDYDGQEQTIRLRPDGSIHAISEIPQEATSPTYASFRPPDLWVDFQGRLILMRRIGQPYEARFCLHSGTGRPISWRDPEFESCVEDS